MKRILSLLIVGGFLFSVNAQDTIESKPVYSISRLNTAPPLINGNIEDAAWNDAEWATDFTQHMPYSGKKPTYQTRFKLLHDDDFIYIAIEAFDASPDSIVKRLTRRDDLDGDFVFIDFDSYHDLRTAFEFDVNAGGGKGDCIISNNGENMDETWDPIWWVKTSIGENAWYAEMKIPFSQLRFDNSGDGIWGINVGRFFYRNEEISFWSHIPADAPGIIHLFGELHGMKGVQPRKQAEIIPYATAGIERYEAEEENPFRTGKENLFNAGIDAKIGLTNNLTLDLSLNPDFGQVEADPSVVNLTAYESFFEEKRPLFIEGKNIYQFPLRWGGGSSEGLFYSRRIGRSPHHFPELEDGEYADVPEQTNILAAAKLSGKTRKGTSIGVLESVTSEEFATIDRNGSREKLVVEPLTNYFVGRVVQDLNEGNTIIGGIATSTYRNINEEQLNFLPVSATTGGIDFQQYWADKAYNIKFVNYASHITGSEKALTELQESPSHLFQRPDAEYVHLDTTLTSLSGFGGNFQFWKTSGNFNILAAMIWKSPGLELNDIGYFRMGDEIMSVIWFGYNFYEPFSIFRRLHISSDYYRSWDFGGNLALGGYEFEGHSSFKNFWDFGIYSNIHGNVTYNSYLRGGPSVIVPGSADIQTFLSTDNRKKLIIESSFGIENGFQDFQKSVNLELEVEYRPINSLNISLEPEWMKNYSSLQYVTQLEQDGETRYIFASIDQTVLSMSIRANLTLTPELTLQYWGQPFIASGDYYDFKHVNNGLAEKYENRYHLFTEDEISFDPGDSQYSITEQSGLGAYEINDPNFHVREFLSNLVLRWEYRPGSYLYAVWSQSRNGFEDDSDFPFGRDVSAIWNVEPTNVFLIKLSYRLGR